jgi:hypothetical protein
LSNDFRFGIRAFGDTVKAVPGKYEIKLNGALERARFNFSDFTDVRGGSLYSYDQSIVQVFVSATF